MKRTLTLFVMTILFTLACMVGDLTPQTSSITLPEMTNEQQVTSSAPTKVTVPTPFSTDLAEVLVPAWVTDFANPILISTADRRPNFQDDFSRYRGWLHQISGVDGSLYAELQDGMMLLELPERTEESFVYNPKINRRNFVLTLDLRFYHDQPNDTVRFQFDQSADQSIAFDLSNNRNWEFRWGDASAAQATSGIYQHFPPEHVPVTIIMQGTKCAVYLNHDPLTYSDNCRAAPTSQSKAWTVNFRLIRDTTSTVIVNFDNLKLWDLDRPLAQY